MLKQIMPRDCLPRVIPKSYKCFGVGAKGGMYRTTDQIPKELESIDSIWKSYILSHLLFNQHTTLDNLLDIWDSASLTHVRCKALMKEVLGFAWIMNDTHNKKTIVLVRLNDIQNNRCSLCCPACFPPIICQNGLLEKCVMLLWGIVHWLHVKSMELSHQSFSLPGCTGYLFLGPILSFSLVGRIGPPLLSTM